MLLVFDSYLMVWSENKLLSSFSLLLCGTESSKDNERFFWVEIDVHFGSFLDSADTLDSCPKWGSISDIFGLLVTFSGLVVSDMKDFGI